MERQYGKGGGWWRASQGELVHTLHWVESHQVACHAAGQTFEGFYGDRSLEETHTCQGGPGSEGLLTVSEPNPLEISWAGWEDDSDVGQVRDEVVQQLSVRDLGDHVADERKLFVDAVHLIWHGIPTLFDFSGDSPSQPCLSRCRQYLPDFQVATSANLGQRGQCRDTTWKNSSFLSRSSYQM